MKIANIKVYTMDAFRTNWTFVKVETDDGLYRWGEAREYDFSAHISSLSTGPTLDSTRFYQDVV